MTRSRWILLIVGAFLAGVVGWLVFRSSDSAPAPVTDAPASVSAEELVPVDVTEEAEEGWSVTLFFPGQDGRLHSEERRLATAAGEAPEGSREQVALLVQALLGGPKDPVLRAPFPSGVELLGVEVLEEQGVAWVDLGPRREIDPPTPEATQEADPETENPDDSQAEVAAEEDTEEEVSLQGGSKQELLVVYSLVGSVVRNVEGVERVGLLWNGNQGSTFAGHVDTTRPLRVDDRYLAQR